VANVTPVESEDGDTVANDSYTSRAFVAIGDNNSSSSSKQAEPLSLSTTAAAAATSTA